ncbi:hypothetical protein CFP56_008679 [Quercus suber]|uniref:Uncharacterized protein n=1 Tax=Quercus suber TaxID=58331 RepID=A0AAW0M5A8_QUESU
MMLKMNSFSSTAKLRNGQAGKKVLVCFTMLSKTRRDESSGVKEEPKKTPIGNLETHGRWKIQLKLMGCKLEMLIIGEYWMRLRTGSPTPLQTHTTPSSCSIFDL